MLDVKRFGRLLFGRLLVVIPVLALSGCDAKIDAFFAPLGSDGGGNGGGNGVPAASSVPGTYTVSYDVISTTCEPSLAPFDVDADFTTEGSGPEITLSIRFPDAPASIVGTYVVSGGDYSGTTGPVDIGDGFDAEEMWDVGFSLSGSDVTFEGTSDVEVTESGSPVCMRMFMISGVRIDF